MADETKQLSNDTVVAIAVTKTGNYPTSKCVSISLAWGPLDATDSSDIESVKWNISVKWPSPWQDTTIDFQPETINHMRKNTLSIDPCRSNPEPAEKVVVYSQIRDVLESLILKKSPSLIFVSMNPHIEIASLIHFLYQECGYLFTPDVVESFATIMRNTPAEVGAEIDALATTKCKSLSSIYANPFDTKYRAYQLFWKYSLLRRQK